MVRVIGSVITVGVNRGVLNLVAPTPSASGEAIADGKATASEATAVPARRRVTGKRPGCEAPSSTE
eukprot:2728258-Heterocapsa_arctica.AAC.1